MSLTLITPPAIEPVTLAEAKVHLKVDTTDDDALIMRAISGAGARAEWHVGRAFITQSWMLRLDCWPQSNLIEIPLPPLQVVNTITTYAMDDAATVLDPASYQVDTASAPARIVLRAGASPPLDLRAMDAVEIAFTAGYGDDETDVPAPIREAILEFVAHLYVHRGEDGGDPVVTAQALLAPYRMLKI